MGFLHSDTFLICIIVLNAILFIWAILTNIRIRNIYKKEKKFMEKIGDGKNIKEDLDKYMNIVNKTNEEISKLSKEQKRLDKKTEKAIQKVGVVRYNAYKDTGSDLSFAICLLDQNNDGVVLNGIYSRDMSNIYAKPIEDGMSKYTITPEEQEAINKAIN